MMNRSSRSAAVSLPAVPAALLAWAASGAVHAQGLGPGGGGGGGGGLAGGIGAGDHLLVAVSTAVIATALFLMVRRAAGRAAIVAMGAVSIMLLAVAADAPAWLVASLLLPLLAAARAATVLGRPMQAAPVMLTLMAVGAVALIDPLWLALVQTQAVSMVLGGLGFATIADGSTLLGGLGPVFITDACLGVEGTAVGLALSASLWLLVGASSRRVVLAAIAHGAAFQAFNLVRIGLVAVAMHHSQDMAEDVHAWGALIPLLVHAALLLAPLMHLNRRRLAATTDLAVEGASPMNRFGWASSSTALGGAAMTAVFFFGGLGV